MAGADSEHNPFADAEADVRHRLEADLADAGRPGTRRIRDRLVEEGSLLELDLRRLGTAGGRSPSADALEFREEIGVEPRDYLLRLKMEAARDLLRHRSLKVWQIADALGYTSQQAFRRGFKKVFGVSPGTLAKQLPPAEEAPAPASELTDDRVWYAATVNALDPDALRALTDRLRQITDDSDADVVCFRIRDTEVEMQVAEEIWSMVGPLDATERRRYVEQVVRTDSPAFFELLGTKYRSALSRNLQEALELAELALIHLNANAERLGEGLPALEALAHAWRGYALHRRAPLDSGGDDRDDHEALQAFRQAWSRWDAVDVGHGGARVEARICLYESYLLFALKRDEDALSRLDRAIVLARVQELPGLLVEAQLQRMLLLCLTRSPDDVAAEADLVLAELRRTGLEAASVYIYSLLGDAFALAGRHDEALRYRRSATLPAA